MFVVLTRRANDEGEFTVAPPSCTDLGSWVFFKKRAASAAGLNYSNSLTRRAELSSYFAAAAVSK